jgi:hypothetical protein
LCVNYMQHYHSLFVCTVGMSIILLFDYSIIWCLQQYTISNVRSTTEQMPPALV